MEKTARRIEELRKATISYKSSILFDGNNLSEWRQEFLHVMNEFGLSDVLLKPLSHEHKTSMTDTENEEYEMKESIVLRLLTRSIKGGHIRAKIIFIETANEMWNILLPGESVTDILSLTTQMRSLML